MSLGLMTLVSCTMNQAEPPKATSASGYVLPLSQVPVPVPTFSGTQQKNNF